MAEYYCKFLNIYYLCSPLYRLAMLAYTCIYMCPLLQLHGHKPLHLAAVKGDMDVMRVLITECGCKADLGDEVCF